MLHRLSTPEKQATMPTLAFDHLHLRSRDPDEAARFYVERLGGAIADRMETPDMLRVVVALGGAQLFIERVVPEVPAGPVERPHRGLEHVGYRVEDLDVIAAELKAAGVPFTMEPRTVRPGLRIAFLLGPDEVLIELLERKAS